jgi:hypothetical protein
MGRGGSGKGGGSVRGGGGGGTFQHGADWICPLSHCAYRNFAYRIRCRKCEAHRDGGKHAQQGGGKGGDASSGGATLAQRQVELDRVRSSHQKKEERLQREKADLKRQLDAALAAAKTPPTTADEDADDDMEDGDEVDVEKELEVARKKKKLMQDVWADDDPEVLRIDELIKKLVRRRDEAKPQRVRLRILERNIDKCQRQYDLKEKQLAELDTKIKELQEEREERKGQVELAAKNLEEARAERAAELQKALEEDATKSKLAAANAISTTGDPAAMALNVIRDQTRARLPGAQPGLGNAIDQALGQLLSLLATLPEQPPSSGSTGAKSGAATAGGGGGGPGQLAGAAAAVQAAEAAAQPGATEADSRRTDASGAIDGGVVPQLAASQAAELRRQQSLAEKQRAQTLAIQQFTENYQAQLQMQAAAREQAVAAAAAPTGTAGAGATGREHIDDDDSDLDASLPSDGESDIAAMQLDRAEGETEQERNNRVANFLAERRKRKKEERRKQRQTRRRADNQGGTTRKDKDNS